MARILMKALVLIFLGTVASAQGQYKIQPGDTLRVEVLEDQTLNRDALVLPDGSISMPLVGSIPAKGRTLSDVQASIVAGLKPNFASTPNVFVTVASLNQGKVSSGGSSSINVYVMGAVNSPGKLKLRSGTTLLQALAQAGGFTKFAATKRIQVRRTNRTTGQVSVFNFNYKAIENGSANASAIFLKKGDVIVVPERRLFE